MAGSTANASQQDLNEKEGVQYQAQVGLVSLPSRTGILFVGHPSLEARGCPCTAFMEWLLIPPARVSERGRSGLFSWSGHWVLWQGV